MWFQKCVKDNFQVRGSLQSAAHRTGCDAPRPEYCYEYQNVVLGELKKPISISVCSRGAIAPADIKADTFNHEFPAHTAGSAPVATSPPATLQFGLLLYTVQTVLYWHFITAEQIIAVRRSSAGLREMIVYPLLLIQ